MRPAGILALALIAATLALIGLDRILYAPPTVELDARSGSVQAPGRLLARIQANMERVALGDSPWPLPAGATRDPLERLVDAVDAFQKGRMRLFSDHVAAVRAEAWVRLARQDERLRSEPHPEDQDKVMAPLAYGARLAEVPRAAPLLSLVQAMRLVDAVLVLEETARAYRQMRYDLVARRNIRKFTASEAVMDGVWLRLPCPLVKGRRAGFEAAATTLGELTGPLLSCPVPDGRHADFSMMERLARHPADFAQMVEPPSPPGRDPYDQHPPPPPWDVAAALRFMDVNADGAEPPLRLATLTGATARLDLALFLHAFREPSPARDEEIRGLMAGLDSLSLANMRGEMKRFSVPPLPYDGTDSSLVPGIRLAAMTRVAEVASGDYRYPYAIPCAVLTRHPQLLEATRFTAEPGPPDDDSMVVDFIPALSGCLVGRGRVDGFPESDLAAYLAATAAADGGANAVHGKMPRYPVRLRDTEKMWTILFEPRAVLGWPEPPMEAPYQTWGYASLGNRAVAAKLAELYATSRASLAVWLQARGLAEDEGVQAAAKALFHLSYGADCGRGPPPGSLRRLVMDRVPLERMLESLGMPAEPLTVFTECAAFAPFDPLLHVAVGHPSALPFLWQAAAMAGGEGDAEGLGRLREVNLPNHFGKTALMAAAQADRVEAARFLLEHGARVNADTWQQAKHRTLAHDSRTALMYAAAQGSAEMIGLLLDAGADRFQADTRGRRAVHYLLGLGPMVANPRLSAAERADLAGRLY